MPRAISSETAEVVDIKVWKPSLDFIGRRPDAAAACSGRGAASHHRSCRMSQLPVPAAAERKSSKVLIRDPSGLPVVLTRATSGSTTSSFSHRDLAGEASYRMVIGSPEWYRRLCVHPHSATRVIWDSVSMVFLLYNAFIVPLRLCFDVTDYCPSPIFIFESITDAFFVRPPLLTPPPSPLRRPHPTPVTPRHRHAPASVCRSSTCSQISSRPS